MVICNFNVTSLPMLKYIIHENSSQTVMADIFHNPYVFFDTITPFLDNLFDECEKMDLPIVLADAFSAIQQGSAEAYLPEHHPHIIDAILKKKSSFASAYEALKDNYASFDICICMLACFLCESIGLIFSASDMEAFLPPLPSSAPSSRHHNGIPYENSQDEMMEGFFLEQNHLMYKNTRVRDVKTVATQGGFCAYTDVDGICIVNESGKKRILSVNDVGDIALDGDGGIIYLKKPYTDWTSNLCAISDEEYPDAAAVALSVCGYQYALLLHDGSIKSNIPLSHKAEAELEPLIDLSVSQNLILGITQHHKVFSSDDGILTFQEAKKALAFGRYLAVLHLDGRVSLEAQGRYVADHVQDMEGCRHGLFILQNGAICLLEPNGRKRILVENNVLEMAVSDHKLIYRKLNGTVGYMDL